MNPNQSIINPDLEPWTFTIPLALEAHSRAEEFRRYQSNPGKAKQVYLNTLAVYAVHVYLQCRGFETDLERSDSWNPRMQMLMDTADLLVKDHGKLECRPVLPEAEVVGVPPEVWEERMGYVAVQLSESLREATPHSPSVPPEVWEERMGYVAVQLSESLREATLLGFVQKVAKSEVPLSQLRSLGELPGYLHTIQPVVNLSQWFEDIFEAGWQAVEALLGEPTELTFNYRSASLDVRRWKQIELTTADHSVALIVALTGESEQDMDISVEVQPTNGQTYLPANLQLMVLNEDGEVMMHIQAGSDNQTIQLELGGEAGDRFGVKVALGEVSVTENFII